MNYNFVDTNLCDFTSEIRAIMAGKTPQRRYGYADPSLSRRLKRDVLEKKQKNVACKDGKDDGKISFKEKLSNFGKCIIAPIKTMFSSPKNIAITALSIAGGAALIALTGGAAAPIMAAAGIVGGVVQIGRGIYNQATAKTDEQAQKAWQQMGSGTFTTAASAISAKASLKAAKVDTKGMSFFGAIARCFKDIPKNISNSFKNASTNIGSIVGRIRTAAQTIKPDTQNVPTNQQPNNNVPLLEAGDNNIPHTDAELVDKPIRTSNGAQPEQMIDVLDNQGNVIYSEVQQGPEPVINQNNQYALPAPKERLALPAPGESVSDIQPQVQTPVQETPISTPAPKHFSIKSFFRRLFRIFGF